MSTNDTVTLTDNATGNSQDTILQTPLSPDNKNGMSWVKGELSKVPSDNVVIKHSKIVHDIKQRRGMSKQQFKDG